MTNSPAPPSFSAPVPSQDMVLPFQIEATPMRGRLVRLGPCLDTMLRQHDYPHAVNLLLAQTVALTAALGTSLKFDGIFTVQTQTDGPVHQLIVDVTSSGAIRACARFDAAAMAQNPTTLLGQGQLVFTVDQNLGEERYQGIVEIKTDDLAHAFQLYFKQSEQIPTGLTTVARQDETGAWQAACLLLQKMPTEGGVAIESPATDTAQEDPWHTAMALMQTSTIDELCNPSLSPDRVLYRLFHELGVRAFDPQKLHHACRCNRERIVGLLQGLSAEEKAEMVQEDGKIAVTCQFCSALYSFDPEQVLSANG